MKKKLMCMLLEIVLILGLVGSTTSYAREKEESAVMAEDNSRGGGYDTTAPRVNSAKFLTPSITKPGVAKVELDVTEEESGIVKYYVSLALNEKGSMEIYHSNQFEVSSTYFTGKIVLDVPMKTTIKAGQYYIQRVYVEDAAGNKGEYYCPYQGYETTNNDSYLINNTDNSIHCTVMDYKYLEVKDEFDVDFDTSLSNPNLPSKLSAMPEGKTAFIRVDSASSYICTKAVFDAIKGKNKTIMLSMDNIQWVFNGTEIVNDTKDININAALTKIPGSTYSVANQPLKISFHANGLLPGKAKIRIKSDYTSNLLNINGNLYLYYLNGENPELEKSTQDIEIFLDGQDHWCEFDITHNSDFLLTGEKLVPPKDTTVKGTAYTDKGITYKVTDISAKKRAVSVTGIKDKKKSVITIPDKVRIGKYDYKVTSIGKYSFKNCKKLTKVTLGKNISQIGSKAFYGNKKLKQIYIKSAGLKSIGNKAFGKITKKAVIKVPSKKFSQYSKLLKKSGINKNVTVKKIS